MKVDEHQNDVRLGYCHGEPCTDILIWIKNLNMEMWNHRSCLLSKPGSKNLVLQAISKRAKV